MKKNFVESDLVLAAADEMWKHVYRADYPKAFKVAKRNYLKHPKNAYSIFLYAVQLGDSVVSGFDPKAKQVKREATKLLKPLLSRLKEIPAGRRSALRNEYYWFSEQGLKQYRLGLGVSKRGVPTGYYSMGVGAWSVARKYALLGQRKPAEKWAEKSKQAWEAYFKYNRKYYNAWAWYARPLGLLGDQKAMMKALKVAMQLSGKSIQFLEFQEVLSDNQNLQKIIQK
jgi:hypothetical protein